MKERSSGSRQAQHTAGHARAAQGHTGFGTRVPHDLSRIRQPVLVANGDHDVMVATSHSADMARRLPDAQLMVYPDSGHGAVFQYHQRFVKEVLEFLER